MVAGRTEPVLERRSLRRTFRARRFMDRTWPQWAEHTLLWLGAAMTVPFVVSRFAGDRLPEFVADTIPVVVFGAFAAFVGLVFVQHGLELHSWFRAGWSLDNRELVFRYLRSEVRVDRSEILAVCLPRDDRGPYVTIELSGDRGLLAPLIDPADVDALGVRLGLGTEVLAATSATRVIRLRGR